MSHKLDLRITINDLGLHANTCAAEGHGLPWVLPFGDARICAEVRILVLWNEAAATSERISSATVSRTPTRVGKTIRTDASDA